MTAGAEQSELENLKEIEKAVQSNSFRKLLEVVLKQFEIHAGARYLRRELTGNEYSHIMAEIAKLKQ